MIVNIYAIRDSKIGFLTPTFDQNDASAARNFSHACMNKESLLFTHAVDYELFCIGSYDSDSGEIEGCLPRHVISGIDVRKE